VGKSIRKRHLDLQSRRCLERLAGNTAGILTQEDAKLLDPTGQFQAGTPLCPPEDDAETGMVATNNVAERTGNVSAGTSVFAMIVFEKPLSKVYPEVDIVTTPTGKPVAMVHSNNCTSDLNAWVGLFQEFTNLLGVEINQSRLFEMLFKQGLAGNADGGGLLAYNYFSGEHITHLKEGRPLFIRTPESRFTLANFMHVHLFSALGALKIGMDYFNCTLNYRRIIWLFGRAVRSAPDHQLPPI
jgi:sugar (pentulose or hexulose) kinase